MEITDKEREEIQQFMDDRQAWFNLWLKGDAGLDSLEELEKHLHDEWKLVNKETSAVINTKQDFLQFWLTSHGRFKDKKYTARREVLRMEKLSEQFFMVLSNSIRELDEETDSLPATEIFIKDETGNLQSYYVHE